MLAELYRKYFRHQCVNHPDLLHADAAGSRVFQLIDVEEALGDFRSGAKEKGYIFRLVNYTYQVGDNGNHETLKEVQGGFLVAKHFSSRKTGTTDYYTAVQNSERITDDIIEKMFADSRNGHPLWHSSLDSRQQITVQPQTLNTDSYTGWLVIFRWWYPFRDCITSEEAPDWGDGGKTPFVL